MTITILLWLAVYLVLGTIVLVIFDTVTKGRIHNRLNDAAIETQSRLASSGNYVGKKAAGWLFAGTLWFFWPAVLVGAMTKRKGDPHGKENEGTPEEGSEEEPPAK